uniref:Calpain catalytic domain-containing protein n=1 Tax=Macrostomum lignano TaxID=282301 RepID=A0A1I8FAB2_9PLAT
TDGSTTRHGRQAKNASLLAVGRKSDGRRCRRRKEAKMRGGGAATDSIGAGADAESCASRLERLGLAHGCVVTEVLPGQRGPLAAAPSQPGDYVNPRQFESLRRLDVADARLPCGGLPNFPTSENLEILKLETCETGAILTEY